MKPVLREWEQHWYVPIMWVVVFLSSRLTNCVCCVCGNGIFYYYYWLDGADSLHLSLKWFSKMRMGWMASAPLPLFILSVPSAEAPAS